MLNTRSARRAVRIVSSAAASALLPCAALAWNDYGHELAAYIAYQDLTPDVRAKVNALLHEHPQYQDLAAMCPDGFDIETHVFMRAATWPDMLRSDRNPMHESDHHGPWHYINIPFDIGEVHGPQPVTTWTPGTPPQNVIQALARCSADLTDPATSVVDKAKDVSWIEHMTGDLHQPLHSVALFSVDYPAGDQGGNLFWISFHDRPTKLHGIWDQMLGNSRDSTLIAARGRTLRDNAAFSRSALADQLAHTTVKDWVDHSADLARTVVYDNGRLKGVKQTDKERLPKDAPPLPEGYREKAEAVAEQQIVLAGYRMADELNALLVAPKPPEAK